MKFSDKHISEGSGVWRLHCKQFSVANISPNGRQAPTSNHGGHDGLATSKEPIDQTSDQQNTFKEVIQQTREITGDREGIPQMS